MQRSTVRRWIRSTAGPLTLTRFTLCLPPDQRESPKGVAACHRPVIQGVKEEIVVYMDDYAACTVTVEGTPEEEPPA